MAVEAEKAQGIGIGTLVALDYLAVGAAHGGAVAEDGKAVLGIVVENAGAEYVVLLVPEFDKRPAELGQVFVYVVIQLFAGEFGIALDHTDVAEEIDDLVVLAPEGSVALEVGAVVEENRVRGLAHQVLVNLHLLNIVGTEQAQKRIALLSCLGRDARQGHLKKAPKGKNQSRFTIFFAHPLRLNSQSPNRGSMVM